MCPLRESLAPRTVPHVGNGPAFVALRDLARVRVCARVRVPSGSGRVHGRRACVARRRASWDVAPQRSKGVPAHAVVAKRSLHLRSQPLSLRTAEAGYVNMTARAVGVLAQAAAVASVRLEPGGVVPKVVGVCGGVVTAQRLAHRG